MKKCKCKSSNRLEEWQTDDLVKLQPPIKYFYNQPAGEEKQALKPVWIDACIAPVIKHLWDNEIYTRNSCCGHNGLFGDESPGIVFDDDLTKEKAEEIRKLIAEVDDRRFSIHSHVFTTF